MKEGIQMEKLFKPGKYYSRVKTVFVAFLIFFPGSLTVVHRNRQLKSGRRHQKSGVRQKKSFRVGQQYCFSQG